VRIGRVVRTPIIEYRFEAIEQLAVDCAAERSHTRSCGNPTLV
jgi:hypothetical protein